MNLPLHRFVPRALALMAAAILPATHGQTSASTPASEPNEEVVTLPDFTVTGSAPSEYLAAESITGTRVATKLRDLPFTVNVITAEFISDFAALEFGEQLAYTSGVVPFETLSTGYSVRGIDANVQLRNGFRRIGLIDKVNVDRIEVIKGAAASIYGTVQPGGTVNVITKKPLTKREDRISGTFGSNNLVRGEASSTGPLGQSGKLFYRVDLAAVTNDYDIAYKHLDQWTVVPQLLWKVSPNTSVSFEYEYLNRKEEGNATIPLVRRTIADPYRRNPGDGLNPPYTTARTFSTYERIALEIFDFNFAGPEVTSDRFVHTVTTTLEHKFNQTFSLRSSGNWYDRNLVRDEVSGRANYDAVTRTVARGVGRHRPFGESGASWQTDLLASWKTGSLNHKTLLTVDYQRQAEYQEQRDTPAVAATLPDPVFPGVPGSISVDSFNYEFVSYKENPALYTNFVQQEDNSLDIYGVFLSHRTTFLQDRAILLGGVRYDYVDSHSRDLRLGNDSNSTTDAVSYQVGTNFRIIPAVTVYANVARSFVPDFSTGIDFDGSLFSAPNEVGTTSEVGLKAGLFDNRLTFTTALFDIERKNVRRDAQRDDGSVYDVVNGGETSQGFEIDYNWIVVPKVLQFFGQYSYIDSAIVGAGATPGFEGGPTRRTPQNIFSTGMKITVAKGPLKGLALTGGYRFFDEARSLGAGARRILPSQVTASNPFVNNPLPDGSLPLPNQPAGAIITVIDDPIFLPDGREAIYNEAYETVQAGISYSWRTAGRYRHKIQFNVNNLLDERYTVGANGQGPARNWLVSYDLRF